MTWVAAFGIGVAVAAACAWLLSTGRVRIGPAETAAPRADRWHHRPTPAMGGVAIFGGFAAALVVVNGVDTATIEVLVAAGIVFALGLGDDVWGFRPAIKLAGQVSGAVLFVALDVTGRLPGPAVVAIPATIGFLVLASNALNLLDNMDSVAAGVMVAAVATLGLWGIAADASLPTALTAALLGGLAGFLLFNLHPARLFMGDSGSLWLGMLVAALALAEADAAAGTARSLLIPVLLLAVPLLDTAVVVVARAAAGRPIMVGGTDHTAHRLVRLGLGQRPVAAVLVGLAGAGGGAATVARFAGSGWWVAAPLAVGAAAAAVGAVVLRAEPAQKTGSGAG